MMSEAAKQGAIRRYHSTTATALPMVYSVWEDGEITLEKGGELFGQRNMHVVRMGVNELAWPLKLFPQPSVGGEHARIYCKSEADALAFSKLILGW